MSELSLALQLIYNRSYYVSLVENGRFSDRHRIAGPIRAYRIESKSAAINDVDPRYTKKHE